MNGLDLLGADPPPQLHSFSLSRGAIALVAGAVGMFAWRRHPVLGFLNASALASNAHAVVVKERRWQDAGRRLGRHLIATAGSLAMPRHGLIGYLAGAVGADMLIDGEGSGVIEEWARYTGVGGSSGSSDIIDAEIVEEKPTTALAVQDYTRCLECGQQFSGFRGPFRCKDHANHMASTGSRGGTTRRVDGGGPPGRFPGGQ